VIPARNGRERWPALALALFCAHYATTEPPRFGELTCVAMGTGLRPERLLRVGADLAAGRIATDDAPLLVVCPTVEDPPRAPDGCHTLKVLGDQPYELADG
jgi:phytoene dehydrogenase-like protein